MSMPEMSDDELDDLLRRGFEQFPEERSLAAWWRLEEQLQAATLERQVQRRARRWLAAELVLLIVGALLWLGWPTGRPAPPPTPGSAAVDGAQPTRAAGAGTQPPGRGAAARLAAAPAALPPSTTAATLAASAAPREVAGPPLARAGGAPAPGKRLAGATAAPLVAAVAGRAAAPRRPRAARLAPAGRATPLADPHKPVTLAAAPGLRVPAGQPKPEQNGNANGAPDAAAGPQRPAVFASPAEGPIGPVSSLDGLAAHLLLLADSLPRQLPGGVVSQPPLPVATSPVYRLSVALVGAPQLSAVRFSRLVPPGHALGLRLEYRLTSRLRVNAGVLQSRLLYDAQGPDYHMPAGTGSAGATLVWTSGSARLLEVPLSLRYTLLARPRATLFAGAGVVSRFLRQEHYRYDYLIGGRPAEGEAGAEPGRAYLFNALTVSAGFERSLGGRWAVQAEPFATLPLRSLGMGQVMVSSAGLFISLKYSFLSEKVKL